MMRVLREVLGYYKHKAVLQSQRSNLSNEFLDCGFRPVTLHLTHTA